MRCNDSAQVISDCGKKNKVLLREKTLECFVEIYGAEAVQYCTALFVEGFIF